MSLAMIHSRGNTFRAPLQAHRVDQLGTMSRDHYPAGLQDSGPLGLEGLKKLTLTNLKGL